MTEQRNETALPLRASELYEQGDLIGAAEREAAATEKDGYQVTAAIIRDLAEALTACRKERDEVYAVNAANNYDRAIEAREALEDIVAMCEPERVPLPLLNSKVIRRAREVVQ